MSQPITVFPVPIDGPLKTIEGRDFGAPVEQAAGLGDIRRGFLDVRLVEGLVFDSGLLAEGVLDVDADDVMPLFKEHGSGAGGDEAGDACD